MEREKTAPDGGGAGGVVRLRDVREADLPAFFEHQKEPDATRMADFPSRDRSAFMAHWAKILADDAVAKKTILVDAEVAGNVVCFEASGRRLVGYWIGQAYWGRGVATRALRAFLDQVPTRPLHAHVAKHNLSSRRVLEKCGFTLCGETDRELTFELTAPASRIRELVGETIEIVPYDPRWPDSFREEAEHLRRCLPREIVGRIEHFGSTAVPGLAAKPIIDLLVEVSDLKATRERIVPILEAQGYEYFWRPTRGDDGPPFYAWFIKRDARTGARTHHVHMVERHFREHWDRLLFRDYLIEHEETAAEYETLKRRLAAEAPNDRVAYARGKTEFIVRVSERARRGDRKLTPRARGEDLARG